MSLARAVTKRMKRTDASSPSSPLQRTQSMKNPALQIDRAKISSPVALISTTNMLSYNAPDIATLRHPSSSTSSTHSADDSDNTVSTRRSRSSSHGSRDTLTDASSVEGSPTTPTPNHLSAYFSASGRGPRKSASSGNLQQLKEEPVETVPAIPERALSHSKRAHERLAQKRSLQNIHPRRSMNSDRSSREHRSSVDMFTSTIQEETPEVHPFGKELEQLNEVAEEFGGAVRSAEYEADIALIREQNLAQFCAAEYIAEIQPLFSKMFGIPHTPAPAPLAWI
ncbi:hypothetical protein BDV95DRAFT_306391 [Massariosphaeria phaeospora]|uniref:Uncharacterized protein n=1 Tax=Massariosphaeria phaeospora TaxID=100035 RepID=A0A7C8MA20_9PLEO|nr:hypothetical protein BDV95DRAFT_306391 [Massariosphaeria phaeospora]